MNAEAVTGKPHISIRRLGWCVALIVLLQACVYAAASVSEPLGYTLLYFDPAIVVSFIAEGFGERTYPGVPSWAAAAVMASVAYALVRHASLRSITTYLVIQSLVTLPTLAFMVLVAAANLPPSEGFSVAELPAPTVELLATGIVPLVWAWRLRRQIKASAG